MNPARSQWGKVKETKRNKKEEPPHYLTGIPNSHLSKTPAMNHKKVKIETNKREKEREGGNTGGELQWQSHRWTGRYNLMNATNNPLAHT